MAGIDLVMVDHSVPLVELLGQHLNRLGLTAHGYSDPHEAVDQARARASAPPDIVLVDVEFPGASVNGLDVMMAFKRWCPESRLIVYTAGGSHEEQLLRVAWESIGPASAVCKSSPLGTLMDIIKSVSRLGRAEMDPSLRALLPLQRSPWRTADGYRRLVPHLGHAKLWKTLLDHQTSPSYKVIADESKLSVNTIRNYRDDLLAELRLHGLENPSMRQIHQFAHSVRPLLAPVLDERFSPAGPVDKTVPVIDNSAA